MEEQPGPEKLTKLLLNLSQISINIQIMSLVTGFEFESDAAAIFKKLKV